LRPLPLLFLPYRADEVEVPTPADVGLPYEDVTLTTSDRVNIKAYVIPARRSFIPTPELQAMSREERVKAVHGQTTDWAEEMGTDEAINVGPVWLWRERRIDIQR
jgi:hypothetical protein